MTTKTETQSEQLTPRQLSVLLNITMQRVARWRRDQIIPYVYGGNGLYLYNYDAVLHALDQYSNSGIATGGEEFVESEG